MRLFYDDKHKYKTVIFGQMCKKWTKVGKWVVKLLTAHHCHIIIIINLNKVE